MAAVASRYARALVDVVMQQKIDPDAAVQQVNSIIAALKERADLRKVWEAPDIPAEQKRNLLDAIGQQVGLLRTIRNFFAVLIDHQRIAMVEQIARQFQVDLDVELDAVKTFGFGHGNCSTGKSVGRSRCRQQCLRSRGITGVVLYQRPQDILGALTRRHLCSIGSADRKEYTVI